MWQCIECEHENPRTLDKCEKCSTLRPTETLVGEQISQWQIESELGEGGMAVVFQARHKMLGSPVAIKVLRADLMHKREVVERFRTEALAASHLRHDNVIQVHDFGKQEGVGVYMVLEFLEGMDLEMKLEAAPLPVPFTVAIARQICAGLEAAHNAKIIHRDLKPSNIYLVPRNDIDLPLVKILDFGIAKIQESQLFEGQQNLTRTGTVLGTPYYLSPEQLRRRDKQELGPSVDIYAFGVIIYQMLSGHLPIEEPTLAEQMAAILTKTPLPIGELMPELKGTSLELLLQRLLAKKPEERPATIGEVWEELEKAAGAFNDPEIDAALRRQWKVTYKTPDIEPLPPSAKPSFFAQYGLTMLLSMLLILGGGSLTYLLMSRPTKTKVVKRPPPPRRVKLPQWASLKNKGAQAFQAGNYLEAIKLWRKSLSRLKKRKSGKGVTQEKSGLLRSLGIAAQKSNRTYAALRFYQQLSSSADLKPEERQQLLNQTKALKDNLSKLIEVNKLIGETFRNDLKSKDYKSAYASYLKLIKNPDRSLPDPFVRAAAGLKKLVPSIALKLYDKASTLALSNKEKKDIKDQSSNLRLQLKLRREAMTTLLGPGFRPSGKTRRTFQSILLKQSGDVVLHQAIQARIGALFSINPSHANWLLRLYNNTMRRIAKKPAWVWLKNNKRLPSPEQLKTLQTTARKESKNLRDASRSERNAAALLKRQKITKMLEARYKQQSSLEAFWSKLGSLDGPIKGSAQKALKRIKDNKERLRKLSELWGNVKKQHEQDLLEKASPDYKTLQTMVKGTPLEEAFAKKHEKWTKRHEKAKEYLTKADKFAKRRGWSTCRNYFDRYLRLYPKASNVEDIKLKRCKCSCKMPAPFEQCSDRCKLPY